MPGRGFAAALQALRHGAEAIGQPLSSSQVDLFGRYLDLLLEWAPRLNLTTILAPEQIVRLHFVDSLACLSADRFPNSASVLDVGSGAGFPGVPLKIARPDLRLTLVEASRRKAAFLDLLVVALGLDVEVLHHRGELLAHQVERRERYDRVLARATAPLVRLLELCLPFVEVAGKGLFPKGPAVHEEVRRAATALEMLGALVEKVHQVEVPGTPGSGSGARFIVVVRKVAPTPARFPRSPQTARRKPLGSVNLWLACTHFT